MVYKKDKNINDDWYTPEEAIKPILKYLKPNSLILCPFDEKNSNYVKVLKRAGHKVYYGDIKTGQDFFKLIPPKVDYIISNPPFSKKTEILKRLYDFGIPFAMLLPVPSLDGLARFNLFKTNGLELLIFNKRIHFNNLKQPTFGSAYFCWNILPKKIIFEELERG